MYKDKEVPTVDAIKKKLVAKGVLVNYSNETLGMNWSNNLSKKLRNSYNAMKRLLRGINI
jgi:hypothetical protein